MTVNQAHRLLAGSVLLSAALITACQPQPVEDAEPGSSPVQTEGLRFVQTVVQDPSQIAARVGDTLITIEDVRREAVSQGVVETPQALQPEDQAFRDTLSDLIDQRLLALEAVSRGVERSEAARLRLAAAEERILGDLLVEQAIASAVTEDAIQSIYDEQSRLAPRTEEIRARHILVETREEADEVARLLSEGQEFGALAAQVSRDVATRFNGGDLGYFTRSGIVPAFAQMAFETSEGSISAPFETEYGWHVLEVVDRRWQSRESLETVRPNIVRFLTLQGIDDLLDVLRDRYPVTHIAGAAPSQLRTPERPASDTELEPSEESEPEDQVPGEDAP